MARMTFNVPDDLARAFDEALKGQPEVRSRAATLEAQRGIADLARDRSWFAWPRHQAPSAANNVSARRGKRLRKRLSNVTR